MPSLPIRLEEDLDKSNPANFISGFQHKLDPTWKNKIIVPPYGAFYTKGMVIRDSNGIPLQRGKNKDYVCIQTPLRHSSYENVTLTELTGFETAQLIVIINDNITDVVYSDLWYVGGSFSFINNDSVLEALKSLQLDTRPIKFDDIEDKPPTYLPAHHFTDANDIMNLSAVCFWLEKIYEAILMGDQKQWDYFYDYVKNKYPSTQDLEEFREEISNPAFYAFLMSNS